MKECNFVSPDFTYVHKRRRAAIDNFSAKTMTQMIMLNFQFNFSWLAQDKRRAVRMVALHASIVLLIFELPADYLQ